MKSPYETESIPFSEIQTARCPKCASEPGNKCHVLAGKNVSYKTKTAPHMERVFAFLNKK